MSSAGSREGISSSLCFNPASKGELLFCFLDLVTMVTWSDIRRILNLHTKMNRGARPQLVRPTQEVPWTSSYLELLRTAEDVTAILREMGDA
jgi:hypothetical protein